MKKIIVAPSLLSADFSNLSKDIEKVEKVGVEWLHLDVMDGHFVPNISFGQPVVKSISSTHKMINDVHIMISDPKKYAKEFVEAGADVLTFHYEACKDNQEVLDVIKIIHYNGAKVGISIKPNTDVEAIFPYLELVDLVLIMSVEPGFGGQSFMPNSLDKIKTLKQYLKDKKLDNVLIEIDGGINNKTAKLAVAAGVDILVAGSYLFGHEDIEERIELLRNN